MSYLRYRYLKNREGRLVDDLKMGGIAFVVILALRGLVEINGAANPNRPGWLPSLVMAAAMALFFAFVFPWLFYLLPGASTVVIEPEGIASVFYNGVAARRWRWIWEQIAYCKLYPSEVGGKKYHFLTICDAENNTLGWYSLGKSIHPDEIEAWFQKNQKTLYRT